jgi:predicted nucleic acid-binding protein
MPSRTTRVDLATVSIDAAAMSSDPADAHVCALALGGDAGYLFTFDRGYLRDPLTAHHVQVLTPDESSRARSTASPRRS